MRKIEQKTRVEQKYNNEQGKNIKYNHNILRRNSQKVNKPKCNTNILNMAEAS